MIEEQTPNRNYNNKKFNFKSNQINKIHEKFTQDKSEKFNAKNHNKM